METQSRVRVESVPREACERLQEIARPHIDSFNFFCEEGLQSAVQGLEVVEVVERVRPTDRDSAIKHVMKDTECHSPCVSVSLSLSLFLSLFLPFFLSARVRGSLYCIFRCGAILMLPLGSLLVSPCRLSPGLWVLFVSCCCSIVTAAAVAHRAVGGS